MWLSCVENPEIVRAIYAEEIPTLENVDLREIRFINGYDLQCSLKFDTRQLPRVKPDKWVKNKVNTVQIDILLLKAEVVFFQFNGTALSGALAIELANGHKEIIFYLNEQRIFVLKATWINIQSISGYSNQ